MKFRIQVKSNKTNAVWWEEQDRYPGEPGRNIRGFGRQPDFDGDIQKFGRELIAWYNAGCEDEQQHRTFLAAELLEA